MSMSSSITPVPEWLVNLSITDPRCANDSCTAYKGAHAASQARVSWDSQFHYGWYMCWTYAAILGIFAALHLVQLSVDFQTRRKADGRNDERKGPGLFDKVAALVRSMSYRRLPGKIGAVLGVPSAGVLFLILIAVIASTAMIFTQAYYYREKRGYGSPPIGVRTGLMSASLIPLLIALSGKFNLVTMTTGYGYEKLNVFHRAIGWLMFILSTVHTIPFIYVENKEGILHKQWYKPGAFEYTGVPPFAVGFFLAIFAVPWIRGLVYELFVYTHILGAMTFLGLCFWHFGNEGDSWLYLWATLAIWLSQILGRMFGKMSAFKISEPWFQGHPTIVQKLNGGEMVKLTVLVPRNWTWKPGNHVFLRFPTLAILDHHPFTIASIPNKSSGDVRAEDEPNKFSFIVRAHTGFTRRLLSKVLSTPDLQLSVLVDGPYGSKMRPLENIYDDVILLAGGGGITAILPWALHLASRLRARCVTRHVRVAWIIKHGDAFEWAAAELRDAISCAPHGAVSVEIYVTEEKRDSYNSSRKEAAACEEALPIESERGDDCTDLSIVKHFDGRRPDLSQLVSALLGNGRSAVIGCGPESLRIDLSNAVAAAQTKVVMGGALEVMLHTETFDW